MTKNYLSKNIVKNNRCTIQVHEEIAKKTFFEFWDFIRCHVQVPLTDIHITSSGELMSGEVSLDNLCDDENSRIRCNSLSNLIGKENDKT